MNIVFVHLNSKIPKFLKSNLESSLKHFPKNMIYLVHNFPDDSFQVAGVKMYRYSPNQDWQNLENNLSHPKDFRGNFWLTSLGRFIALADFMQNISGSVVHIESDNIFSADFPVSKFSKLESEYAFPIVSRERGIASLVYFKTAASSRELAKFVLEQAKMNNTTSDMLVLREFYNLNKHRVQVLPTGLSMQASYLGVSDSDVINSMKRGMELFGGVFDGSDLGVYFLGTDPRNRRGISRVGSPVPHNFADIQGWKLVANIDRRFVDLLVEDSESAKVFSIHATCKRKKLFQAESQFKSLQSLLKKFSSGRRSIIYPDVFALAFCNSFVKRLKSCLGRFSRENGCDKSV